MLGMCMLYMLYVYAHVCCMCMHTCMLYVYAVVCCMCMLYMYAHMCMYVVCVCTCWTMGMCTSVRENFSEIKFCWII